MKKVLILAYDFPPFNSVGSKRPYGWYKNLKEHGLYPIVITRDWDCSKKLDIEYVSSTNINESYSRTDEYGSVVYCPFKANIRDKIILKYGYDKYSFLRKFFTLFYSVFQYVSFVFDNKSTIYYEARKFLEQEDVDIIVASGEPFVLFRYANKLSEEFNIPWVADYRDGWSLNYELAFKSKIEKFIGKVFFSYFEKKLVKTSEFIVTVSEPLAKGTEQAFNKKGNVIRNGYDSDAFDCISLESEKNTSFTIAYSGKFYPYQRLDIFAKGLKLFLDENPKAKINLALYGPEVNPIQKSFVTKYLSEFRSITKTTNRLDYFTLIKELSKADLLLLLANESIDGSCTKVYDYLALKKRILLSVNDHSTLEQLLKETNSGMIAENENDVFTFISDSYKEWEQKGFIESLTSGGEIYSKKNQTKVFANILLENVHLSENKHKKCVYCSSHNLKEINRFHFAKLYKCNDCGFVFSKNIPTKRELYECYSEIYGEDNYYSPITEKRYNEILDSFEPYRKSNCLLDYGCGEGLFLDIAKKRGWNVFGIEYSETHIKNCRERGLEVFDTEEFHNKLKDISFDVITSFEVIEHISNPRLLANNAFELLRVGGVSYITTPNYNSISKLLLGKKWNVIQFPEHLVYFTPKTIKRVFKEAGFKEKSIVTTGISITRMKLSKQKTVGYKVEVNSEDEKLRRLMEKNKLSMFIKNLVNTTLTLFGKGDTIKAYYEKK